MAELPPYLLKQLLENDKSHGTIAEPEVLPLAESDLPQRALQVHRSIGELAVGKPDVVGDIASLGFLQTKEESERELVATVFAPHPTSVMRGFLLNIGDMLMQRAEQNVPHQTASVALLESMFDLVDIHDEIAAEQDLPGVVSFGELHANAFEFTYMSPTVEFDEAAATLAVEASNELNYAFSAVAATSEGGVTD